MAVTRDPHHDQRAPRHDTALPSEWSFGVTFACVFALISGWLLYSDGLGAWAVICALTALAFLAVAFIMPEALRPLNRLWMRFGMLLHRVLNPVILGILFFAVFTPMGLVMRLFGADLLRLRPRPAGESYWISRAEENLAPSVMTNQF